MPARLIQSASLMGLKRYNDSRALLNNLLKVEPEFHGCTRASWCVISRKTNFPMPWTRFAYDYGAGANNSRGLMGMVEVYMAQNKYEMALQNVLQTKSRKVPIHTDYHIALVTPRYGWASTISISVPERHQHSGEGLEAIGELYLRIGRTCRRKGDHNAAIQALQRARAVMPDNTVVLATLALTLDTAAREQEARLAYGSVSESTRATVSH